MRFERNFRKQKDEHIYLYLAHAFFIQLFSVILEKILNLMEDRRKAKSNIDLYL